MVMENRTKKEVLIRTKAGWSVFGKYREFGGTGTSHESNLKTGL